MKSRAKKLLTIFGFALASAPVWQISAPTGPSRAPAAEAVAAPAAGASEMGPPAPPPPTAAEKTIQKKEKEEAKAVVETTKVLDDLVCDPRLLNDLNLNLTGIHCINVFDHKCAAIWGAVLGANGVAMGVTNTVADVLDGKKAYAKAAERARDLIAKEGAASEKFAELYEKLSKTEARSVNQKYFTQEEMRLIAIKELEAEATTAETRAVTAALKSATVRSARAATAQTAAKWAGRAFLPISGAMTVYSFVSDSGTIPCESSSWVDLVPDPDGQGCKFSFDTKGPKFRAFMKETRDKQLDIIRRDKVTCRYLNIINEQLKGNLIAQGQILSQVKYSELPVCRADGRGVSYNVQVPAEATGPNDKTENLESYQVNSDTFSDTTSLRSVSVKELGMKNGFKDVKFLFQQGENPKYVETTEDYPGAFPTREPLETFRSKVEGGGSGNTKVRKSLRILAVSTYWTPIIGACCTQAEPDRPECWKKVLPGLKGAAVKAAEDDRPIPETKPVGKSADASPGQK